MSLLGQPRVSPPAVSTPPPTRPRVLDYLLIFCGVSASIYLAGLSKVRFVSDEPASTWQAVLFDSFAILLFLPVGVILLWPLFFTLQKILGRTQGLTSAEWLWGLAWLESLALAVWMVLQASGNTPEFLSKSTVVLGYAIVSLSLGLVALLIFLIGLIGRWAMPWTHVFSLALLIWPALPLALWWSLALKLE